MLIEKGRKTWRLPKLPRLPSLPRIRRLPPQLERLLQGNLVLTAILVLTFVSFGVAAALMLGRVYEMPILTAMILLVAGFFAL